MRDVYHPGENPTSPRWAANLGAPEVISVFRCVSESHVELHLKGVLKG